MDFSGLLSEVSPEEVAAGIHAKSSADVERALQKTGRRDLEDFKALISVAADPYLEEMARLSRAMTRKRFGKTIQMYAPVYLSNECQNICTYCGFSQDNQIPRKTLSDEEIIRELLAVKEMGFDHVLLVTGEANQTVGVPYLINAVRLAGQYFSNVSIEVQPLKTEEYIQLSREGLYSVLVYQETYQTAPYSKVHPRGRKANFGFRLNTADRLGEAEIHKIGLGVLIGLADWRVDSFYCAMHLDYLERRYWKSKYSISFPRLRPHSGDATGLSAFVQNAISDRELTQLICAYRIFNEDLELSLSTRESPGFRDRLLQLGVTTMSAGSKTNPGGYAVEPSTLEQFEIDDTRSPKEVAQMIRQQGYEPVWKDWDRAYHSPEEIEQERIPLS